MSQGSATVKQVLSGDSVVLVGAPKGGPPPEKRIHLSNISAPKVAQKSLVKEVKDEPCGWESREVLRKLVLGKVVEFKVDSDTGDMEFGSIKYQGEQLSHMLLQQGMARVRNGIKGPEAEELQHYELEAQKNKVGIWATDAASKVRDVKFASDDRDFVREFVEKNKGKRMAAIVENVRDGGCYTLTLLPDMMNVVFLLAGVTVDQWRRVYPPAANIVEGAAVPSTTGPSTSQPEPFAAECKYQMEVRLLNREIELRIEGCDEYGNILGSLFHNVGGNVSLYLLKEGFAKINDGTAKLTESVTALRDAMKEGQNKGQRKWKNFRGVSSSNDGISTFDAKVLDVLSGDALLIRETASGEQRRVYVASIRSPRPGNRNREGDPWAYESREFARRRLIGKRCKATVEYIREPTLSQNGAALPPASDSEGRMHFISLLIEGTDKAPASDYAELVISEGLARTIPHREEESRAANFDKLIEFEEAAKQLKKNVHGPATSAPKHRINDLCGVGNAAKARSFEQALVRAGKVEAVVEHVFHAARFKIRISSENVAIPFCLGGIKCPATARLAQAGQKPRDAEPFGDEAADHAKNVILQHDVVVKIEQCDRGGNFYGSLWRKNQSNFAKELLQAGLAQTEEYSLSKLSNREELQKAEESARDAKLKIWTLEIHNGGTAANDDGESGEELMKGLVVVDASSICDVFLQNPQSPELESISAEMKTIDDEHDIDITPATVPKTGELVLCKFSADNAWYRARIEQRDAYKELFDVLYIDYGNKEKVHLIRMKKCPLRLSTPPPQAFRVCLSGLVQPPEFGAEAKDALLRLSNDVTVDCQVEKVDSQRKRHVILTVQTSSSSSSQKQPVTLNALLVRDGLALVDKRSNTSILEDLLQEEKAAKKSRMNVWRYGDVDYDEDENSFVPDRRR